MAIDDLVRFKIRRRTSDEWAALNEVLLDGEDGFETDTGRRKTGDGVHFWSELGYTSIVGNPDGTISNESLPVASMSNNIIAHKRSGNTAYDIIDANTGEYFSANKATTKPGGSAINESDIDSIIYFQIGTEYFKRNIFNSLSVLVCGAVGDGVTDDTAAFQKCMDYLNTVGAGTMYIPKTANGYAITALRFKCYVDIISEKRVQIKALPSAETGLFILQDSPVQFVTHKGFELIGNPENAGQHGYDVTAKSIWNTNQTGGMWHSTFQDIEVSGFPGHQFHFHSTDGTYDVANQFLTFNNVRAYASASATSRALYSIGQFGQIQFNNCLLDGKDPNLANSTNIEIISSPGPNGTDNAYTVHFIGLTCQNADIGIKLFNAKVVLTAVHFENCNRQVWATNTSSIAVTSSEMYSRVDDKTKFYAVRVDNSSLSFTGNIHGNCLIVVNSGNSTKIANNVPIDGTAKVMVTEGATYQAAVNASKELNALGNTDILVNLENKDLIKIISNIGLCDELRVRGVNSGISNGYIRILQDGTGNITLPLNHQEVILRQNDVAVFSKSDLSGTYILKSIFNDRKGLAAPTSGYWFRGEKIYRTDVSDGSNIGWVCTTAGYTTSLAWLTATAYSIGAARISNGKVYRATTAGTSGATAPTHLSGSVSDGGVTWSYEGVPGVFTRFGRISDATTTDSSSIDWPYSSAVDASLTLSDTNISVFLVTVTANRVLNLPTPTGNEGKSIIIFNRNLSPSFNWSYSGTVVDNNGVTVTAIPNNAVITLHCSGTAWRIQNEYGNYKPLLKTGVSIAFETNTVYGSKGTPEFENITGNINGAKVGVTCLVIHNHVSTPPTFDSKFKKLSGSGNYVTGVINYIECTYIAADEIIYSIQQRT